MLPSLINDCLREATLVWKCPLLLTLTTAKVRWLSSSVVLSCFQIRFSPVLFWETHFAYIFAVGFLSVFISSCTLKGSGKVNYFKHFKMIFGVFIRSCKQSERLCRGHMGWWTLLMKLGGKHVPLVSSKREHLQFQVKACRNWQGTCKFAGSKHFRK